MYYDVAEKIIIHCNSCSFLRRNVNTIFLVIKILFGMSDCSVGV